MIDLLGSVNLFKAGPGTLWGEIGLAYGWEMKLKSTVVQDLELPEPPARFINPANLPTANNGRRLIFSDNEPFEPTSSSRLSLRSGLTYDLPLFDILHIQPGLSFDYGLTAVATDSEWKMHYLTGRFAVMMKL